MHRGAETGLHGVDQVMCPCRRGHAVEIPPMQVEVLNIDEVLPQQKRVGSAAGRHNPHEGNATTHHR